MLKGASGLIAVVIAVVILLCLPVPGAADVYRTFEYFEGLPADYVPAGGQGINFRESSANSPTHTLGAGDLLFDPTLYTCVGWKDGIGISPASGTDNSVTFNISSDVSIVWIYKPARSLTIKAEPLEVPFNELWGGGKNDSGQLGGKSIIDSFTLARINTDPRNNFTTVSGVYAHSAALRPDGSLWTWGWNGRGQLGDNSITNRTSPTLIEPDKRFTAVAAGSHHTVAIRDDGSLWAWGLNSAGELGNGTTTNNSVPQPVGTGLNWRSVAAGFNHTMAIKTDGTLWAWGYQWGGRLGNGVNEDAKQTTPVQIGTATNWRTVTAGDRGSMAIKADGSLWVWGEGLWGDVGSMVEVQHNVPTRYGTEANWLMALLNRNIGDSIEKVLAIRSVNHAAFDDMNTLYGWGRNDNGQLGDGTITARYSLGWLSTTPPMVQSRLLIRDSTAYPLP